MGDRDRGERIVQAIEAYQAAHGYPPTMRWLMEAVGVRSTSVVAWWLRRLERQGRIVRGPAGSKRTVRVRRET